MKKMFAGAAGKALTLITSFFRYQSIVAFARANVSLERGDRSESEGERPITVLKKRPIQYSNVFEKALQATTFQVLLVCLVF